MVYDTLELLRPKMQVSTSWDEASQAADVLDKEFTSKLGQFSDKLGQLLTGFISSFSSSSNDNKCTPKYTSLLYSHCCGHPDLLYTSSCRHIYDI